MANTSSAKNNCLGILVGGGPAPGINGVISAITLEARTRAHRVVGIYNGFELLMKGDISQVKELNHDDVSRIHFQGGSILNTSRANPTKKKADLKRVIDALDQLGISHLASIGGDDTMFAARPGAQAAQGKIRVLHLAETIDHDLPLPGESSTLGFLNARPLRRDLVQDLM